MFTGFAAKLFEYSGTQEIRFAEIVPILGYPSAKIYLKPFLGGGFLADRLFLPTNRFRQPPSPT